ncbi:GvpL/GvpF family gas vesicle protein [Kitasatospora sp. NPDC057904]|uniref:GvpL/GvpF family gas vesicle protein n=1 Tax=unclassified Kitasatospora TaxID=2633591 RepID=UPI0036D7BC49
MNRDTPAAGDTGPACYVYGIVPADAAAPTAVRGVGTPPAAVELLPCGRVAALVSEVDPTKPLGTPDDLRAHARVLDSVVSARVPVLPFRFGSVVDGRRAVVDELLGPSEEGFALALESLRGLAQYTLRGSYVEDRVLRDVLAARPDIAALRERTASLSADTAHYDRLRLGELVAREIADRGEADVRHLVDTLGPLAVAVTRGPGADLDQPIDVSFLVHHTRWARFEAEAEDLARGWSGRVGIRLLGPLAPYDFAPAAVGGGSEGVSGPWA